jgi:pyruvate formate lyase activating enzyme
VAHLLSQAGEQGIDRCIETAGAVPWAAFHELVPLVDRWLFDCKSLNRQRFRNQARGDATVSFSNLHRLLATTRTPVQVRLPLIAGFNDDSDSLHEIGSCLALLPRIPPLVILPGHDLHVEDSRSATVAADAVLTAHNILLQHLAHVEVLW